MASYLTVATDDQDWCFDREFLASSWSCIYGRGCRGCHPSQDALRADGCCTAGTVFMDGEDFFLVSASVAKLDADVWQYAAHAARAGGFYKRLPDGSIATRVIDGACIMLNRPGFATGPGCALHHAAVRDGEDPMLIKPNVCWQFPLHSTRTYDNDGRLTTTVRPWKRTDWKGMGTAEWWCTDAPEAYCNAQPLVKTMERELRSMCGDAVYEHLLAVLANQLSGS